MSLFDDVERRIDAAVRELFRSTGSQGVEKEMVEVQKGIVEDVLGKVERLPRARKLFPYNHLSVRIALPGRERRAAYEAVFSPDAIRQDLLRALRDEGAEHSPDLQVHVALTSSAETKGPGFVIRYTNEAASKNAGTKPIIPQVIITKDASELALLSKARIHLGRVVDVQDARLRTIRKNDVVLEDETVSRAHAHIGWDAPSASFRLFDDGSTHGTSVWRDGRLMPVPKGPKGFALRPGDELVLGQARVGFDIRE